MKRLDLINLSLVLFKAKSFLSPSFLVMPFGILLLQPQTPPPPLPDWHMKRTGVLVENFENNPKEVSRYCLVGVV